MKSNLKMYQSENGRQRPQQKRKQFKVKIAGELPVATELIIEADSVSEAAGLAESRFNGTTFVIIAVADQAERMHCDFVPGFTDCIAWELEELRPVASHGQDG